MLDSAIETRTLAYKDSGTGFPVVFGHSYLWDAGMWAPQIDFFKSEFRCIVPEVWGHGDSPSLDEPTYPLDTLAGDHCNLTRKLGLESYALVGLSLGGMWAVHMALMQPERIKALVLMDTSVDSEPKESRDRYFTLLDMAEQFGGFPEAMINQVLPIFFSPYTMVEKPDLVESFGRHLLTMPEHRMQTVITMGRAIFNRESLMDRLSDITIPTLIMVGEDDRARPVHEARAMAELIPHAELKVIPRAGHVSNLEQPALVNSAIQAFLLNVL